MPQVQIKDKKLWVGSEPVSLLGGEVHYWRLAPESWRVVLEQVKEMGLNVLATYVCWEFHETAPGRFDFEGKTDPRRDLRRFLDLLTEMGFWIIIRPGPYIYSEWSNAGVPEQAARYHRLDGEYLRLARRYLEAVVPVLRPYFATRGGRVILCQADNELDCWPHMYTEALGLGRQPGLYQVFLEERYGTVEALNLAWGTDYEEICQARAILSLPAGRQDLLPRYLDFYRFKHWYVLKASRWLVDTFRELGVEIPILMNTIAVHTNEPWAEMEKVADLVGTDLYPSNTFQRNPAEHRQFLEAVRYLRTYSCLPYISEFEAGIWHGGHGADEMGALEPNHYRMAVISALLGGVAGWNWYMLVNRDNWYMSPINEWGRRRVDLASVFEGMASLFKQIDPTRLEKLTQVAVTIDPLHEATRPLEAELLRAFYRADMDYEFFDVHAGKISKPFLFYGGGCWLDRAAQLVLSEYVQNGGHLICLGDYPYLEDGIHRLNLLGIPEPAGILGDMGAIALKLQSNSQEFPVKSNWLAYFQAVEGEPIFVQRQSVDALAVEEMQFLCNLPVGERYLAGFTRVVGKGRLTYLGLQPTAELLQAVVQMLAIPISCQATSPQVSTALFKDGEVMYLCAVNWGQEGRAIEVRFGDPSILGKIARAQDLVLAGRSVTLLPGSSGIILHLPGKDATVIRLSVK